MKKVIKLLILLFIVSCTKPQKQKSLKCIDVSIENISIDSLRKTDWHISKGRRLYYPQYEDSGYHYIAYYEDSSSYSDVHFHIIQQDTFILNNGKWYPTNLNKLNKK